MKPNDIIEISSPDKKHVAHIRCLNILSSDLDIPDGSKLAGYGFGGKCPACGSAELNVMIERKAAEFRNEKKFFPGVYCRTCGIVYEYSKDSLLCPVCRSSLTLGKYSTPSAALDFYPILSLLCSHCSQEWDTETIIGIYNSGDEASWVNPVEVYKAAQEKQESDWSHARDRY